MSPKEDISSIADASRPNAGRIYDYLLGGNHNFEIDRQAAEQVKATVPGMTMWARLIRWFLGEAVRRLLEEGFTKFLDFASGLPTVDHIHLISPKDTKVVYSDIDPVTVAYAQDIVKDDPDVVFEHCDCGQPENLLNSDIPEKLFGKDRKLAIGYNGVTWFLPNESVGHAMKVLYDWAEKGSKLFISMGKPVGDITEGYSTTLDFYKNIGQPIFSRTFDEQIALLDRWELLEPGFLPLEEWLRVIPPELEKAKEVVGGSLVGAILKK